MLQEIERLKALIEWHKAVSVIAKERYEDQVEITKSWMKRCQMVEGSRSALCHPMSKLPFEGI